MEPFSRGVCNTDENGYLKDIVERVKIKRDPDGIFYYEDSNRYKLEEDTPVSMNLWGLKPNVFGVYPPGFPEISLPTRHGTEIRIFYSLADQR